MNSRLTYDQLWRRLTPFYDDGEAKAIVRLLLDEAFQLSLPDVLCGALESLDADQTAKLEQCMQRLVAAEPVQYVIGHEWFAGRRFNVSPAVLIPRPETERLVALTKAFIAQRNADCRVLDVGTGSGCIAVSIAAECPEAEVVAWDLSNDALDVAQRNAESNAVGIDFQRQDALNPPCDASVWDVVVSNPPYICASERREMARHVVDFEPAEALFVPDDDALRFYRAIARYAIVALRQGGALFFETHTSHAHDVARLVAETGFTAVEVLDDLFDKPRFVVCQKP